jgi:hypothetical protein
MRLFTMFTIQGCECFRYSHVRDFAVVVSFMMRRAKQAGGYDRGWCAARITFVVNAACCHITEELREHVRAKGPDIDMVVPHLSCQVPSSSSSSPPDDDRVYQ